MTQHTPETAAGNGQAVATARTPSAISSLKSLLDRALPQIRLALPRHLSAERMLRVCLTAAQRTPDLLKCDQLSFVGAVVQASQLGLEPDGILGHAYLVPFNNRKTGRKEVQLIAGYKGLIDLARRSGHVTSIAAHVVYDKDEFTFTYGIDETLRHVPHMGSERGEAVAVYAVAKMKDGGYAFDVMSKAEVEKIRAKSQAGTSGPWQEHWGEMARKTAIRRLVKYLPLSPELQKAAALDELADAGVPQSMDIEIESSAVVAEATAGRQAGLREKYTGVASGAATAGEDAAEADATETGEVVSPEQIARLNSLVDQIDQRQDGAGMSALEKAAGTIDLDALTAKQASDAEVYLTATLAKLTAAAKPKTTGKPAEQGDLV